MIVPSNVSNKNVTEVEKRQPTCTKLGAIGTYSISINAATQSFIKPFVLTKLYTTLVRPLLEYSCVVWVNIDKQSVERLACIKIYIKNWSASYCDHLYILVLQPLVIIEYFLCIIHHCNLVYIIQHLSLTLHVSTQYVDLIPELMFSPTIEIK